LIGYVIFRQIKQYSHLKYAKYFAIIYSLFLIDFILSVVLILFFSLIIILFAVFAYPSISICFMMFNIYLINIIAKILKLRA